jgi:L-methionine (R)-S-oxide reductase
VISGYTVKNVMQISDPARGPMSKPEMYQNLCSQLSELLRGEMDFLANAANAVALIYRSLPDINWAGFYFKRGQDLVLGPFQGAPACTRIPIGQGVCGKAAATRETVIVEDVSKFDGHIVCDPVSQSEIVVPVLNWGRLFGVFDVDSGNLARFDEDDQDGLEALVAIFLAAQKTDDLPDFEQLARRAQA